MSSSENFSCDGCGEEVEESGLTTCDDCKFDLCDDCIDDPDQHGAGCEDGEEGGDEENEEEES